MFSSRKKVLGFLLVFGSISLLVVGIILINQTTLRDRSLDDSAAAGFGITADRTNFAAVQRAFESIDCSKFLVPVNDDYQLITNSVNELNSGLKSCEYMVRINDGASAGKISATIYPYSSDSFIDESPEKLYDRIHQLYSIQTEINTPRVIANLNTFYGTFFDGIETHCSVTLYHPINDFEFGIIIMYYPDFKCDDPNTKALAEKLTSDFATTINEIMSRFY